jgi:ABC-2 type transport system permease protein
MTGVRTIGLVMMRELEARRRAALITLGAFVGVAAAAVLLLGLLTDGESARLTGEDADRVVGTFGVVGLFLAVVFTGQVLLTGVAEEKNSRVVEVVLGTMRPRHLLAGKVIALGLIGFGEVIVTLTAILLFGELAGSVEFPAATPTAVVSMLGWFVLGYAFFSTVYGAAGSMVRRHSDASNAAAPINLSISVGYIIGVISAAAGESVLLQVASLFPPTAPFTMPVRIIQGTAAPWEIALAVLLVAASAYGLIRLAGRIYAGALLRTGRTGWRDAWRAAGEFR